MKTFFHLCLTVLLSTIVLSAVEPDPLSFFPHHVGDIWVYRYDNHSNRSTTMTDIQRDGINNIAIYYDNVQEPAYVIDSNCDVYFYPETFDYFLEFKLTAKQGDSWTVTTYSNSRLMARVEKRYNTLVFGQPSTVMAINYYEVPEPDTVITDSSPYRYTYFLASGFGFIRQIGESGDVPIDLVGYVINGDTLGTVTDVKEQHNVQPLSVAVSPNPCSAFATFHCSLLPGITVAHLTITDIFGNSVYTADITNDQYTINTSMLPNGLYFCTLNVGTQTRTLPIVVQQ